MRGGDEPTVHAIEDLTFARVPLLPAETATRVFRSPDSDATIRRLFMEQPATLYALEVASPVIAQAACKWLAGGGPCPARLRLRLLAYVIRMSTRCTPFGLFASIGRITIGDTTTLAVVGEEGIVTRSRPDMGWLYKFIRSTEAAGSDLESITLRTNDLVRPRGDRLKIWNYEKLIVHESTHELPPDFSPISLKSNALIAYVRARCADGVRVGELVDDVITRYRIGRARVAALVRTLLVVGVLVPETRPSLTEDQHAAVADLLASAAPEAGAAFASVLASLRDLDEAPLPRRIERHWEIESRMRRLQDHDRNYLQVDSIRAFAGTLGREVMREVELLARVALRTSRIASLQRYKQRFLTMYEGDTRIVPLLDFVDPESGIEPIVVPEVEHAPDERLETRKWNLMDVASEAVANGQREIVLTDANLDDYLPSALRTPDVPPGFELIVDVAAPSVEAIDRGEYTIALADSPALGIGRTTARFLDMLGGDVLGCVREVSHELADPSVVHAELVYAPFLNRYGNVALRPKIYDYETCVGCRPNPETIAVSPSDLYVGLSGDRFFLWSKSLGKRVQLHETHLFNARYSATNLIRFLSAVAQDGNRLLGEFEWGEAEHMVRLPRVRYGRIVISHARWKLSRSLLVGTLDDVARNVRAWMAEHDVPQYVVLPHADNKLVLDLSSEVGIELLVDQSRFDKRPFVELHEHYPRADEIWLRSGGDAYRAQFVFNFRAAATGAGSEGEISAGYEQLTGRRVAKGPGSEWVYARFECARDDVDFLLRDAVGPLISGFRADDCLREWFFIRYSEPSPQLRVRIRANGDCGRTILDAVTATGAGMLEAGWVTRWSLETYVPEVERYGGDDAMPFAESIFTLDSDIALRNLSDSLTAGKERVRLSVLSAIPLIDALLPGRLLDRWLDASKHHAKRKIDWPEVRFLLTALAPSRARDDRLDEACGMLRSALPFGAQDPRYLALARSFLHMHFNRFGLNQTAESAATVLLWNAYRQAALRDGTAASPLDADRA